MVSEAVWRPPWPRRRKRFSWKKCAFSAPVNMSCRILASDRKKEPRKGGERRGRMSLLGSLIRYLCCIVVLQIEGKRRGLGCVIPWERVSAT